MVRDIFKLSISHHKEAYDYENDNKYRQKQKKICRKVREDSVEDKKAICFSSKFYL